jgi:hypothetical protein
MRAIATTSAKTGIDDQSGSTRGRPRQPSTIEANGRSPDRRHLTRPFASGRAIGHRPATALGISA